MFELKRFFALCFCKIEAIPFAKFEDSVCECFCKIEAILCIVSRSGEARWEIWSRAMLACSKFPEATCSAQVSSRWIRHRPRSSDLSSLTHGYGDPVTCEIDIDGKVWTGVEFEDELVCIIDNEWNLGTGVVNNLKKNRERVVPGRI
ncbi:hypothetical protein L2E82_32604 [Cichorium intybus]|uniref:Uncharacterized protein n=1 Tax=Cichorium intybus TaxID=13427 RepID=A0ACB9BHN3_CICIN|nr:hypothetical protein L2E82_32604 [Cichorium intybus]